MNRDSYNAIAKDWDEARVSFYGRESEYVDALLEGLPEGAAVLDLGCGSGRPMAEYILGRGYRLTGVDQAEALLALARQRFSPDRFPRAAWVHSSIEDYVPKEQCSAILCWDTLFHINRIEHQRLFARFAQSLLPGGRLMLTFGGSDHPPFIDMMFGQSFYYDSHPPGKELELLAAQGFVPRISEFMNLPASGREKGRYAVVAQLA